MRKSQGKPADVWGVGCVVLEMLTGLPPWSTTTRSMEEFVHQIGLGSKVSIIIKTKLLSSPSTFSK